MVNFFSAELYKCEKKEVKNAMMVNVVRCELLGNSTLSSSN